MNKGERIVVVAGAFVVVALGLLSCTTQERQDAHRRFGKTGAEVRAALGAPDAVEDLATAMSVIDGPEPSPRPHFTRWVYRKRDLEILFFDDAVMLVMSLQPVFGKIPIDVLLKDGQRVK